MGKELSRSEFLKVVSIATAGLVIPPDFPAGVEKPRVLNPLVDANKLPSIEYHSPNFKTVGDKIMTPEVFEAQLDWLKDTNYYTPTSSEVYKYLKGEKILPHPSVMLRFDLGIDKLDENGEKSIWLDVFDNLEKRGLHAHMYLIPDTIEYFENGLKWEDIATYVKKGVISACSHGLKDHPDYRKISENYALESMRISKDNIAKGLLSGGVVNPQILGFAFPFDSVPENPQELIEKGGYYFFAGGTRKNGNNAAIYGNIDEGLPCIYPYVYEENLEAIKINSNNNLALLNITGGESFANTLTLNGNKIEEDKSWNRYKLSLGKKMMLPKEILSGNLVNPSHIVVHTDSQKGEIYRQWDNVATYHGLNGKRRKIVVNFGVDSKGVAQYTSLYQRENRLWVPMPGDKKYEGSSGIGSVVNIEMSGSLFDELFTKDIEPDKREIILKTLRNTAKLAAKLIIRSGGRLYYQDVVGHNEMTVKGKSDPGLSTISLLRMMVYKELTMMKNI